MKQTKDHYRGCLLGGAIGDAIGWPIEFDSFELIQKKYGPAGLQMPIHNNQGFFEISDDTQLSMFTAEGILRSQTRNSLRGISHTPSVVYNAYQRWLVTQGYPKNYLSENIYKSWLLEIPELYAKRAPAQTCLEALSSKNMGNIITPINQSKSCEGLMRVAPAGLFCATDISFDLGAEIAALTHGHPSGYLSAGALAYLLTLIIDGWQLDEAVQVMMIKLSKYQGHAECSEKLKTAIDLAYRDIQPYQAITSLGTGWYGEEALAMAIYCALRFRKNFKSAIFASVNHDGDSDSIGTITGNILGAYLGIRYIPKTWTKKLELKNAIIQLADDLLIGYEDSSFWINKYPGS